MIKLLTMLLQRESERNVRAADKKLANAVNAASKAKVRADKAGAKMDKAVAVYNLTNLLKPQS